MEKNVQDLISRRIAVPTAFEDIFSHFYVAHNINKQTIRQTLFPQFQTIMVFSFGSAIHFSTDNDNQITIEKCIVLGPIKQALNYTLPSGAEMLVANFKGDAFYRFFGQVILSDYLPVN